MKLPTISAYDLYCGIRLVGVFKKDKLLGYVLINIYEGDAFNYSKADKLGIRVLVV